MSFDYFQSLTPVQRKFIQVVKDLFDESNNKGLDDGYIFGRKVDHPELENTFQILANTISKETNELLLSPSIIPSSLNASDLGAEQQEDDNSQIAEIDTVKSSVFSLNEKLRYHKAIKDIEVEIPKPDGLSFQIKLVKPYDIKSIGIRFADGNICTYKFDLIFMGENNEILSEVKGQRNGTVTALMEFYELNNKVEGVDRVVFRIDSKYNPLNLSDTTAKIAEFVMATDIVSEELKQARVISSLNLINTISTATYLNHPTLIKLRITENTENYPTLYEIADSVSFKRFDNIRNESQLKLYNKVSSSGNIINSNQKEGIISIRIGNKDMMSKYEDDNEAVNLGTILKKGYIKYGGYKNRYIAFKIVPIEFDSDNWRIQLVTRGRDIESPNHSNVYQAIIDLGQSDFSFSRQFIENKADTFTEEVIPSFDIELTRDQEIGFIMYQYNLNETDVQYFIYIKKHNDIDWKLYNSFTDSKNLVATNYADQTISWGGIYDYIFFKRITRMQINDLSFGELVTPIRRVE